MPLHHREMPRQQGHAGHRTGAIVRAQHATYLHTIMVRDRLSNVAWKGR